MATGYEYFDPYASGHPPPLRNYQVRNNNGMHTIPGRVTRQEYERRERVLAQQERELDRQEQELELRRELQRSQQRARTNGQYQRHRRGDERPGPVPCSRCGLGQECPMRNTEYFTLAHHPVSIFNPVTTPEPAKPTPGGVSAQLSVNSFGPLRTQPHAANTDNITMDGLTLVPKGAESAVPTARDSQEIRKDKDMQAMIYPHMKYYDNDEEVDREDVLANSRASHQGPKPSFFANLFKRKKSEAAASQVTTTDSALQALKDTKMPDKAKKILGRSPSTIEQETTPLALVHRKLLNARRATLERSHYSNGVSADIEEPGPSSLDSKLDFTCQGLKNDIYDTAAFDSSPTNLEIEQVSSPILQRSVSDNVIIPQPLRPTPQYRSKPIAVGLATVDDEVDLDDGAQLNTPRSSFESDFDGTPSELLDNEPGRLGLPTLADYKAISNASCEIYREDGRRLSSLYVTKMGPTDAVPFRPGLIDLEAARAQGIVLKGRLRSTSITEDSHDELPNADRQPSFTSSGTDDRVDLADKKVPLLKRIKKSLTDLRGAAKKMSSSNLKDDSAIVTATPNGSDIPAVPTNFFTASAANSTERAQYNSGSTLVNDSARASKTVASTHSTSHTVDDDPDVITAVSAANSGYFSIHSGQPATHNGRHHSISKSGNAYDHPAHENPFATCPGNAPTNSANHGTSSISPSSRHTSNTTHSAVVTNLPLSTSSNFTSEIYLPDVVDLEPSATEAEDISKRLGHLQLKLRTAQGVIENMLNLPAGSYPIQCSFEPNSGWDRVLQLQARLTEAHQFIQNLTAHDHPAFI